MKHFVYLVQGQAHLVRKYAGLASRKDADALFLTYDEPMDDAFFCPGSTWAEGRNILLSEARKSDGYEYYIFCDDDIKFEQGSWDEFEHYLRGYNPGIGIPIFPKTRNSALQFPRLRCQPFFVNDEQLIAFHKDVVQDEIVLPYYTNFDAINWWASCEIQQILIQNFYALSALQFNNIIITNTCKKRYKSEFEHHASFRDVVHEWLEKQFKRRYILTSHYFPLRLHRLMFRILHSRVRRYISGSRSVPELLPEKLLLPESEILVRYQRGTGG
ncbi:hypothetical protein ACFL0S_02625 [Thermodesulfobacteriota bacterium]